MVATLAITLVKVVLLKVVQLVNGRIPNLTQCMILGRKFKIDQRDG